MVNFWSLNKCINFTLHKYEFHSLLKITWSMIPPSFPPYHAPDELQLTSAEISNSKFKIMKFRITIAGLLRTMGLLLISRHTPAVVPFLVQAVSMPLFYWPLSLLLRHRLDLCHIYHSILPQVLLLNPMTDLELHE